MSHSRIQLARRQMVSLAYAAGARIVARRGSLWVTQDHDLRDVVLNEGESFEVTGAARVIVQALSSACVDLQGAASEPQSKKRFAGVFDLLRSGGGRASAALAAA
ncbi:MAG TPA: DUF2917 domain-containing protein [Burkholderiaceae bacterium]|nr:DUF2917 domain-containing protein [Burkholderiaceae bacterium]